MDRKNGNIDENGVVERNIKYSFNSPIDNTVVVVNSVMFLNIDHGYYVTREFDLPVTLQHCLSLNMTSPHTGLAL